MSIRLLGEVLVRFNISKRQVHFLADTMNHDCLPAY
jgi:hypothetical protein